MLARAAAAPRLVALAEVELLGEAFFHEVVDRGMEGIEAAKLFTLELGKRRINARISCGHFSLS
jgi:hypothetical protein